VGTGGGGRGGLPSRVGKRKSPFPGGGRENRNFFSDRRGAAGSSEKPRGGGGRGWRLNGSGGGACPPPLFFFFLFFFFFGGPRATVGGPGSRFAGLWEVRAVRVGPRREKGGGFGEGARRGRFFFRTFFRKKVFFLEKGFPSGKFSGKLGRNLPNPGGGPTARGEELLGAGRKKSGGGGGGTVGALLREFSGPPGKTREEGHGGLESIGPFSGAGAKAPAGGLRRGPQKPPVFRPPAATGPSQTFSAGFIRPRGKGAWG